MEQLHASKAYLKMADGRMRTPHPTHMYPPLALSYRNFAPLILYFKYCNPLAPLILFFLTKRQSQKGGGHVPMPPKYASVLTI